MALVEVERRGPLAHAEPDRPGVRPAGAQPHLQVLALPHPRRRLELGPRHDEPHRRVAAPEGRQRLDRLGRREGEVPPPDHGVHPPHAGPRDGRARALGGRQQRVAEARHGRSRQLEPDGAGVPAPARQRTGRGADQRVEVDAGHAAARPLGRLPGAGDDDGRALEALDQARRDDADDALVPAVPRHHDGPGGADLVRLGLVLGDGRLEDLALHLAPLGVQLPELGRDRVGRLAVGGQEQLERPVGVREPPGRVDARRQREPERARADGARLDAGRGAQRGDARGAGAPGSPAGRAPPGGGCRRSAGPRRRPWRGPRGRSPRPGRGRSRRRRGAPRAPARPCGPRRRLPAGPRPAGPGRGWR